MVIATIDDFQKLDMRVGTIIDVADFPQARKPSYKLSINFGPKIGIKKSCVGIAVNYTKEQLLGKQVIGMVNFPPRQIGPAVSEVLTLGVPDEKGECILLIPEGRVKPGVKVY